MAEIYILPARLARFHPFLDCPTMDSDLVLDIGFRHGTLALYKAGFPTIRTLYYASSREVLAVPGIGKKRYAYIKDFFKKNGYQFPLIHHKKVTSLTPSLS